MASAMQSSMAMEGRYTEQIYTLLKEGRFAEVVEALSYELDAHPKSRAALSLIAYCSYRLQDYATAALHYERLVKLYPSIEEYKLYYAQCLYKASSFSDAQRAALAIESEELTARAARLQALIKYETDDLGACRQLVDTLDPNDTDTLLLEASILFKDENYDEALAIYQAVLNTAGFHGPVAYNVALCLYKLNRHDEALQVAADIIERGVHAHPELSVGSTTEGIDVHSVGNTDTLRETALVEAFNLRAAIEFRLGNPDAAKHALSDMPPREESELDPVSLHNSAVLAMDDDPALCMQKLNFLLQQDTYPRETFANLLVLYCKLEYFDLAADVLAENAHLTFSYLDADTYELLEALIMSNSSPEEAFRKLDTLSTQHIEKLRKLTKRIQDARVTENNEEVKEALRVYDESLDTYIPVLMAMAKIYWNMENYVMVEKIFRQSAEFCSEHETWKLNVAHVFFMQDTKYPEAIQYYEPIVARSQENLLSIPAIVLANLCVSYIMTSQNEEAEELMRQIEKQEEVLKAEDPNKPMYHLCIVNLVIGTLYCAKGNFEFGISRVIKSLDPLPRKLGIDTWFYAKRAFASLAETVAKNMLLLRDQTVTEILDFLQQVQETGKELPASVEDPSDVGNEVATIGAEARRIHAVFESFA